VVACTALVTLVLNTLLGKKPGFSLVLLVSASLGLLIPSFLVVRNWVLLDHGIGPPTFERLVTRFGGHPDLARRLLAANSSVDDYFLPRWVPRVRLDPSRLNKVPQAQLSPRSIVGTVASVEVKRWQPPFIELGVQARKEVSVDLHQYFYPGWVAKLDKGQARLEVGPSQPDGLLEVKVPPGTHRIRIYREALPQERAGQIISAVSLLILGLVYFNRRKQSVSDA
jgi:hypothetical protein